MILGSAVYGCIREAYAFQGKLFVHLFVMVFGLAVLVFIDCFIGRAAYGTAGILLTLIAVYNVKFKVIDAAGLTDGQADEMFSAGNVREMWCVYLIFAATLTVWLFLEDFMALKLASVVAAGSFLIISMVMGNDLSKMSVCAFLLYIVSNALEFLEDHWEKEGNKNRRAYFVWVMPFLIVYFMLLAVLPVRTTPYDWAFARNIYRQVRERIYVAVQNISFGGSEDFGISTTGISDEAGFFNDLADDQKEVIHLKKNASFDNAVYLTGKIYDTFDGRKWHNTFETKRKDIVMDTLETFYAVYRYDGTHRQDYIRKMELDVEYRFFHTKYLFTPIKTLEISGFDQGKDYEAEDGWYKFHRQKNFSTQFKSSYYVMNRSHQDFVDMLENISAEQRNLNRGSSTAEGDPEKMWNQILKKQNMVSGVLRYEDLQNYRLRMRGYNMAPAVSEAVSEWLGTVCEDTASDYENMVRIEEALRSFSYNTRPGKLPGYVGTEEEFLDYFLLEKKEGYCSYFATAFVLLARAEGMPVRYVEGYCVPRAKQGGTLECDVMSGMAHAWPEVYFEGVGWIPFEPTPGFANCRNNLWQTHSDQIPEEAVNNDETEGSDDASYRDYDEDEGEEEELLQPEEDTFVYEFIWFILCLMAGAVGIFVLFIILDAVREKVQTDKMDAESRFHRAFRRNLQILEAMGYKRSDAETLSEFNRRLPAEEMFICLYESAFYGKAEIDAGFVKSMTESGGVLLKNLKSKKGIKYYFIRCLLYLRRAR